MQQHHKNNSRPPALAIRTYPSTPSIPGVNPDTMSPSRIRPIPAEKLEKALELYKVFLKAKKQEEMGKLAAMSPQTLLTPSAAFPIPANMPGRRRAFSASMSVDGFTDMSSVVSGQDDLELPQPSSASQADAHAKRVRRKFTQVGKARTHLCRHLGSCDRCKSKGVKCDLWNHHDIALLQHLVDQEQLSQQAASSSSGNSQRTEMNGQVQQQGLFPVPQSLMLQGVGGQLDTSYSNVHYPDNDPLEGIVSPISFMLDTSNVTRPLDSGTELYGKFAHGAIINIGHVNSVEHFSCAHLSGCRSSVTSVEDLQVHFATEHFPYTRITPPIRHVCQSCYNENAWVYKKCEFCGTFDQVKSLVQGHFICQPDRGYDSDHGFSPLRYERPQGTYFGGHLFTGNDVEMGGTSDDDLGRGFDNTHEYNSNNSHNNFYNQPSNAGYGYNNSFGSPFTEGGGSFGSWQGSQYRNVFVIGLKKFQAHSLYQFAVRYKRELQQLLFVVLSLILLLVYMTHDDIVVKIQKTFPHAGPELIEHLPTIGFVFMFLGFGALFLVKHRVRHSSTQSSSTSCSMRALEPYAKKYRHFHHEAYASRHEHH